MWHGRPAGKETFTESLKNQSTRCHRQESTGDSKHDRHNDTHLILSKEHCLVPPSPCRTIHHRSLHYSDDIDEIGESINEKSALEREAHLTEMSELAETIRSAKRLQIGNMLQFYQ